MFIPLKDDVPSRHRPFVNWALIVVNLAVFAYIAGGDLNRTIAAWGVVPASFLRLPPAAMALNVVTATFIHAGWLHVLGNMLFLWIFGDNVEDVMGHLRYLAFYFLTGTIALLTFVFLNPASTVPLVGASGAISGVLGAYFLLFPKARVWTLVAVFPVRLPAVLFLGVWFLIQALNESLAITGGQSGGVAFAAHVGGFVAGMLLVPLLVRRHEAV